VVYYKHDNVNDGYAVLIAGGLLLGAYLGSIVVVRLSEETLRRGLAIFPVVIGARLFIKRLVAPASGTSIERVAS
jgi:uncharacterized membrane protein YfcA